MYGTRQSTDQPGSRRNQPTIPDLPKYFYNLNLDAYACPEKPPGDVLLRVQRFGQAQKQRPLRSCAPSLTISPSPAELDYAGAGEETLGLWVGMTPSNAKSLGNIRQQRDNSAQGALTPLIRDDPASISIVPRDPQAFRVVVSFKENAIRFHALVDPNSNNLCEAILVTRAEVFFAPEYRDDMTTTWVRRKITWHERLSAAITLVRAWRLIGMRDPGRRTLDSLDGGSQDEDDFEDAPDYLEDEDEGDHGQQHLGRPTDEEDTDYLDNEDEDDEFEGQPIRRNRLTSRRFLNSRSLPGRSRTSTKVARKAIQKSTSASRRGSRHEARLATRSRAAENVIELDDRFVDNENDHVEDLVESEEKDIQLQMSEEGPVITTKDWTITVTRNKTGKKANLKVIV
ncbi:hypothetical protein BT63DRAFT_209338 [Microthyrium microscopicum]|uniref:Uncharacterized protein n=1 Tax=Microthyrium microscopicum TaxID=703497 RepID=A0A6A6UFT0_9PEZI|nr:hypothetical protein BT63DRAFT_209338 [Microthyrium microscopicum]